MTSNISQSAGDNTVLFGSIGQVGTINILRLDSEHGGKVTLGLSDSQNAPKPRSLPVSVLPRPFPALLARREEVQVALNTLPYNQTVEFYGDSGIGKTAILRYLAHHPALTPVFSDGIIYHHYANYQSESDLLQILFDGFYESATRFKPTDIQIREALKNKKVLILLDGGKLTREEVQSISNNLPSLTFLFANSDRSLWGEGNSVKLAGLPLKDAISLVTRELGRSLSQEEYTAAEALCTALEGHPLRILQAVGLVREENLTLTVVSQRFNSQANYDGIKNLLSSLSKPERMILIILAALGINVALGAERIADLIAIPEVKPVLENLLKRHLVQVDGERYSLSDSLFEYLKNSEDISKWMENITNYFKNWILQNQGLTEVLLSDLPAILSCLEWAFIAGRWHDILSLGTAIEPVLALSGQWGIWEKVLQWLLAAAQATGNQVIEALALHQLGTRSLCLNQLTEAQNYLNQALQIRESINDQAGVEVTKNNLQLIPDWVIPKSEPIDASPPIEPIKPDFSLWFKFGAGFLFFVIGWLIWSLLFKPPRVTPSPSPTGTSPATYSVSPEPVPIRLNSLTLNPAKNVKWGAEVTGIVSLDSSATNDVVINLQSNDNKIAKMPANILIPAGRTTGEFKFTIPTAGDNYQNGKNITITASYNGVGVNQALQVESYRPIPVPSKLKSLSLNPVKNVKWGAEVTGIVSLDSSATNDVVINLQSNDNKIAKVPANILIPAGRTTGEFKFTIPTAGDNYQNGKNITITASYNGVGVNQALQVESYRPIPVPSKLKSLSLNPAKNVKWGAEVTGIVSLDNLADDDIIVNLKASNNDVAKVPPTVLIQKGTKTGEFKITIPSGGVNYPNGEKVTITASHNRVKLDQFLQVQPYQQNNTINPVPIKLISLDLNPSKNVQWGAEVRGTITLNKSATDDVIINLESSDNDYVAKVPATVLIQKGTKTGEFKITVPTGGDNYLNGEKVTITASYKGVSIKEYLQVEPYQSAPPTITPVPSNNDQTQFPSP
jgi:hypothetical protein